MNLQQAKARLREMTKDMDRPTIFGIPVNQFNYADLVRIIQLAMDSVRAHRARTRRQVAPFSKRDPDA